MYLLLFLQLLDLSRNRLNGFDDIFVWKLRQIKDVKIMDNPLVCDRCHMGALIDIAQTVRYKIHTRTQSDMVIFSCMLAKRMAMLEKHKQHSVEGIQQFKSKKETKKDCMNGPFYFLFILLQYVFT